jgi:hypothetical protein
MNTEVIVYGEKYTFLSSIQQDDAQGKVFKVYNKERVLHTVLVVDDEYNCVKLYIKEGDEVVNDQVDYTTYYEVIGVQQYEIGEMLSHLLKYKIKI